MTLLCDVCLEPTPLDRLVDCADWGTQHCGGCGEACRPCIATAAEDQAAEDYLDVTGGRCP